jgi:hypothetical protein
MDSALFLKYQLGNNLVTKAVERINPCYEIAKLFCEELNKTAGQSYTNKKTGKKGKLKSYTEVMVLNDLKAINKDVHAMNSFLFDCQKSELGFRRYFCWKLK